MKSIIDRNKEELRQEMENLCESPITYNSAQRLVTCHKAYKVICKLYGDHMQDGPSTSMAAVDWAPELTLETAKRWVAGMENADGTRGAHWSMEKTEEVRKQRGVDAAPLEFWAAMNMMYSDYCLAADKLGVNSVEFYVCMSKAFLEDRDARPEKLARYYEYIAKH